MNRSGYVDCDEGEVDEWRRKLNDTIASPEGQAFLRELADVLDALPDKVLIDRVLINDDGDCCALGAVCKARGIDTDGMDNDTECVAERLGVPKLLAAEVVDHNDTFLRDTPETRWQRMRKWVDKRIRKDDVT